MPSTASRPLTLRLVEAIRALLAQRLVRFILVGGTATAAHAGTTILLVDGIGMASPTLATILGTVVGIATSYLGNWAWTFGARGGHAHHLPRFLLVYSLIMGFNGGAMYIMQGTLGLHYLAPLFLTLVISPILTFLLNQHFVFRNVHRA